MSTKNIKILGLLVFLAVINLFVARLSLAEEDHDEHHHEAAETQHADEDGHDHDEGAHDAHGEEAHDEDDHEDGHQGEAHEDAHGHGEGGHEEEQSVKLTSQQMQIAGIVAEPVYRRPVAEVVMAPGEVMLNAYRTASVTPRVPAQVVARHARLGDVVAEGQALLTLSSVDMANAEGELIVAAREWQRVKKLGRKVVSAQRYTEARVAYEQAKARVIAYGMTEQQALDFINSGDASKANGRFQLLAPQAGTVIKDSFIIGELIEPGRVLFVISDESVLWVEAKLTPAQVRLVSPGNAARIRVNDKQFNGRVVQVHHALDEDTRTLGVRIEVENPDDQLHPGVFVQAVIDSNNNASALAVPVDAVVRSPDGDWVVFVEHETGVFEPQEVELLRTVADVSVIDGIEEGTRVVTQGAFFVQSELAKSGFEVHNH